MIGHQLGSFETIVILLEIESERAGELGGRIKVMITFVLNIVPPTGPYRQLESEI